jgi:proton-translocating NADH-quinone oxidoreductase chain L
MYLLLILLPLLSSIHSGLSGRFLGGRGAVCVSVFCITLTFFCSVIAFYEVSLSGSTCTLPLMKWFDVEMIDVEWCLYFDSLTVVMLVVITSVSSLVHVYSASYMENDPHIPRFMSYLSLFTFFMCMLVTADNLVQMFFGWEGVGCASYLLINFWWTRLQANKSSIKAMVMNRVGDFGLTIGIMSCFVVFKSVNFATILSCAPYLPEIVFLCMRLDACTVICICFLIGACGKSAQLGLHTWLPDAMEGPTPVSALIHAATMVTAGIFLICRSSILFECAPNALVVVALLGGMTCFFAATTGMVQNDLKRVIAYSTCSQLGYMVFACGVSSYSVAVFHLFNHAFFKALLFLGAGSVIHALSDQQDMRKMGGILQILPFTYAMMCIGTLSLIGFPFLAGFYSKDVILEVSFARYAINAQFGYWCTSVCVLFTAYYSTRLLVLTFIMPRAGVRKNVSQIHDSSLLIAIPLILLAFASIFCGFMAQDMMIGAGTSFWGNALFVEPLHNNRVESEFIPQYIKLLPLLFTLLGVFLAFYLHFTKPKLSYIFYESPEQYISAENGSIAGIPMVAHKGALAVSRVQRLLITLYYWLSKRWLFDKVYNDLFSRGALNFGYSLSFKRLDKGCFEIIGPHGIVSKISKLTRQSSVLQSGMVYHYAYAILIGATFFISIVALSNNTSIENQSRSLLILLFLSSLFLETVYMQKQRVTGKL